MIARSSGARTDDLARRCLTLFTRLMLELPRGRRRNAGDLKELEFLTLTILRQNSTMIVGDIQRILGVLPAQMSRIIRSLEDRATPLVACGINPHDKRKVDVQITPAGEQVLADCLAPRVQAVNDLLGRLAEDERDALCHLLERLAELTEQPGG
jgi:DNA-binding MarR family transcriptional regulator